MEIEVQVYLAPWDGNPDNLPKIPPADEFVEKYKSRIIYVEEAHVQKWGMDWYSVAFWIKK